MKKMRLKNVQDWDTTSTAIRRKNFLLSQSKQQNELGIKSGNKHSWPFGTVNKYE